MNDAPPFKPLPNDPRAERLAKALRENLRRRKAAPTPSGDDAERPLEPESAS